MKLLRLQLRLLFMLKVSFFHPMNYLKVNLKINKRQYKDKYIPEE